MAMRPEDEAAAAALEGASAALALQTELRRSLRAGWVDLASARFSRSFAAATSISASSFPEGQCRGAALRVEEHQRAGGAEAANVVSFTLLRGEDLREVSAGGDHSGLRQRRSGASGASAASKSQDPAPAQAASPVEAAKPAVAPEDAHLLRWLGIRPRGKLDAARKNFERALGIAVRLADHNAQLKAQLDSFAAQGLLVQRAPCPVDGAREAPTAESASCDEPQDPGSEQAADEHGAVFTEAAAAAELAAAKVAAAVAVSATTPSSSAP